MKTNGGQQTMKNDHRPLHKPAYEQPVVHLSCDGTPPIYAEKPVITEIPWPLLINGQYWLTVLCTPTLLDCFVLGFLYNEGLIETADEVVDLQISQGPETLIHVELARRDLKLPQRRTLTSGCGGGITYVDLAAARQPVLSNIRVSPAQIAGLMKELMIMVADEYHEVGGFHTTGLSDGKEWLAIATDIGRLNTLDKIAGMCLQRRLWPRDAILLTTGRISAEMLGKAARMRVPVVATINSPTHLAVELARQWAITLIGYVRGGRLQAYTGIERISLQEATMQAEPARAEALSFPQAVPAS